MATKPHIPSMITQCEPHSHVNSIYGSTIVSTVRSQVTPSRSDHSIIGEWEWGTTRTCFWSYANITTTATFGTRPTTTFSKFDTYKQSNEPYCPAWGADGATNTWYLSKRWFTRKAARGIQQQPQSLACTTKPSR
jgi:hypothetical protein